MGRQRRKLFADNDVHKSFGISDPITMFAFGYKDYWEWNIVVLVLNVCNPPFFYGDVIYDCPLRASGPVNWDLPCCEWMQTKQQHELAVRPGKKFWMNSTQPHTSLFSKLGIISWSSSNHAHLLMQAGKERLHAEACLTRARRRISALIGDIAPEIAQNARRKYYSHWSGGHENNCNCIRVQQVW